MNVEKYNSFCTAQEAARRDACMYNYCTCPTNQICKKIINSISKTREGAQRRGAGCAYIS